jgi:hypothetical protein
LKQERIDYQEETVDLSCSLEVRPTEGFRVLETIRKGLIETDRMGEWGFFLWPLAGKEIFSSDYTFNPDIHRRYPETIGSLLEFYIIVDLYNELEKKLSTVRLDIRNKILFYRLEGTIMRTLPKGYYGTFADGAYRIIVDTSRFEIETGTPGIGSTDVRSSGDGRIRLDFENVNANDITDNLVVKIISVNGVDAETAMATGFIRIASKN